MKGFFYYAGKPPINKYLFLAAKAAYAVTILFLVLYFTGYNYSFTGSLLIFPGVIILSAGCLVITAGFIALGNSVRVGLPREETVLRTRGIYKFSRNPIYLGAHLISVASVLLCQNPLNLLCAIISIAIHHKIILAEEEYLEMRFGDKWRNYLLAVRRYV